MLTNGGGFLLLLLTMLLLLGFVTADVVVITFVVVTQLFGSKVDVGMTEIEFLLTFDAVTVFTTFFVVGFTIMVGFGDIVMVFLVIDDVVVFTIFVSTCEMIFMGGGL